MALLPYIHIIINLFNYGLHFFCSVLSVVCICMVTHISRVWINRERLPILVVVSSKGKMNIPLSPCVPENLVSRDGFGSPVPRQPLFISILRLNLVLTYGIPPEFRDGVHLFI